MKHAVTLLLALSATAAAAAAEERQDATGDWGGARSWLDDRGVHIDVDYTAEVYVRLAGGAGDRAFYRGNVDAMLILDSHKLGLWNGGTLFVYGENGHGEGPSPAIGAVMLVSNLEAPDFTQLSELWFEQHLLDGRLWFRLGKQDSNRSFSGQRFTGNWINSSFGAVPSVPMPTFPAPGLGAVLGASPTPWLELRGGVFEAAPEINAIAPAGDGTWITGAAVVRHGDGTGYHTLGVWTRTGPDPAKGVYGQADLRVLAGPPAGGDTPSVQFFVRGGWSPDDPGGVGIYGGGGATLHGLLGRPRDTFGLGGGAARLTGGDVEGFLEIFYKLRVVTWLTFEPDVQLFAAPGGGGDPALVAGVRGKIKL